MSSIIDSYTAQTATWKRRTGTDQFNDPVFEESTIRVRWVYQFTQVKNDQGEEVTSSARVYTSEPVSIGDVLVGPDGRDWPVITVTRPTTLGGQESHREVMV